MKCGNCGSTEIEYSAAKGENTCTNCGNVIEGNIMIAEVNFLFN